STLSVNTENAVPLTFKNLGQEESFSFSKIYLEFPMPTAIANDRNETRAVLDEVDQNNTWISTFSRNDIVTLPVGVKHYVNEVEYAIGIAKAIIHKDYSELTVFARVRLPQTNEAGEPIELFFGANNVKLSHNGGIFGDANLVLLGDLQSLRLGLPKVFKTTETITIQEKIRFGAARFDFDCGIALTSCGNLLS
ncbi:MAG: hypothetical protein AAGF77_04035, partial [Bacteroidota bacterium]